MKAIIWLVLFTCNLAQAQKLKKADKLTLKGLQDHVSFLADDNLEGRRTGTPGEKLAYEYISNQFSKAGLQPRGENRSFIQSFEVNEGKEIDPASYFKINGIELKTETDYFPLIISANKSLNTRSSIALPESGAAWYWDLKEILQENKDNPHFDLNEAIKNKANAVAAKGAAALLLYNSSALKDELKFEPKVKASTVAIPVIYLSKAVMAKHLKDETATAEINLQVKIADKKRTGHNVVGLIDNGAAHTIILGAHYDHLGYGEDHNSLFSGTTPKIHNGADDNASGTSALIELGRLLKGSKLKRNNYLLIAFSGEELGLYGSKYFTENPGMDLGKVNYMINMDMVGRLNDSTRGLSIGGYGTSPSWALVLPAKHEYFNTKFDSSGTGPSDHTSFYRKDIPVLFFFTGVHSDYHKPSDDAGKINFNGTLNIVNYIFQLIETTDKKGKLVFLKTREAQSMGKSSFKVTLGIMPDYTFSGTGVRVDGVSEGKAAQRVGIKAGDVILQLGAIKFTDVQSYTSALGKFNKGEATKVKVKRGNEELVFDIVF